MGNSDNKPFFKSVERMGKFQARVVPLSQLREWVNRMLNPFFKSVERIDKFQVRVIQDNPGLKVAPPLFA